MTNHDTFHANPYHYDDFPEPSDEWEYSTSFPHSTTQAVDVQVSKVGGGTVGKFYVGAWHYSITLPDVVRTGSDLVTGTAKSHAEAAEIVAEFFGMSP